MNNSLPQISNSGQGFSSRHAVLTYHRLVFMTNSGSCNTNNVVVECGNVCAVTYSLGFASSCGDISDPVVLDSARGWVPPGVHAGGGLIEHNQVGGRCIRRWNNAHTRTHIRQLEPWYDLT